jgi:nicotinamidase-related amidase
MSANRALLVVDMQTDFMPGGALAVPGGNDIVHTINQLARRFTNVVLTQWSGQSTCGP